ncbi:hypothetical protein CLAFUW4_10478 [Fulvia fulva]|uniref:Uncharacterized protein n=1 Tax=Passalora fulva TaxID=5499 RepID=A0A9Q8P830_PASFU|nr:uncharacterized protein CLAFUR5_05093 [Fulvia fulva]KAK4615382.1 hypothetical protein CLAFUR4_10481 [Fulvia fulva]KAK4616653.1 hypothetical protein CLAFUR0_10483 [Fulvia fulva]UJO16666.1 hypothetical protein CLAFUR5_05093 [Fulvia fulva]WPV19624.1 hypothetical protein CLAFUW4_10478 [Fulvia fulva]WPV34659.1 hypothetical protein CLAFUW7_10478 [Fulvia fulva]
MALTRPTPRVPSLKRKASETNPPPRQAPAKLPKLNDTTHFPFLCLPRELRDEIYRWVLLGRSASLSSSKDQPLTISSPLTAVCPQICEVFNDALLFHSSTITTIVRNYNFAHVVTFLNRLSEAQMARLRSTSGTTSLPDRTVKITLSFTPKAKNCRMNLNRWLDRFDVPEKRGKDVQFEYDAVIRARDGSYKDRPHHRVSASQRWAEEARKVERAGQVYKEGWRWRRRS